MRCRRRPIKFSKLNLPGIAPQYCVEWSAGPDLYWLRGNKWFTTSTEALAFVKWLRTSRPDWIQAVSSN